MQIFETIQESQIETETSDIDLVNLTLDHDKNNFTFLVTKYQKPIFAYLLRLLNFNHSDAEDALATTFLKAYQNLASFNTSLKFSSWLYRIAHNEAVNIIKKNVKNYTIDIEKVEISAEFESQPLKSLEIEKVLNKLSLEDRNLIILYYLEEKSYQEISDILKITVNNVAVKLNRAKAKAKALSNK